MYLLAFSYRRTPAVLLLRVLVSFVQEYKLYSLFFARRHAPIEPHPKTKSGNGFREYIL
jgi:hypothetical protein